MLVLRSGPTIFNKRYDTVHIYKRIIHYTKNDDKKDDISTGSCTHPFGSWNRKEGHTSKCASFYQHFNKLSSSWFFLVYSVYWMSIYFRPLSKNYNFILYFFRVYIFCTLRRLNYAIYIRDATKLILSTQGMIYFASNYTA